MAKIAFIVGSYYPNYSANGICTKRICEEFKSSNHEVYCFSRQTYQTKDYYLLEGIHNYRYKSKYLQYIQDMIISKTVNKLYKVLLKFYYFIIKTLYTVYNSIIYPNVINKNIYKIYNKFVEIHSEVNFDLVICVYSPIETIYVGKMIKENLNIPTILYSLDCLNGGYYPRLSNKRKIEKKIYNFEINVYKYFNKIVFLKSHKNVYENLKYKYFKDKIYYSDIPLFKPIFKDNKIDLGKGINLVYTGSLLKRIRNPKKMLEILESLNIDLNVHFYGNLNNVRINKNKYNNLNIYIHKSISHSEVEKILISADFLLNIGNSNINFIPSKIFEYISSGKPIISFYSRLNDPCNQYLQKYPYSLLINENEENSVNKNKIIEFIKLKFDRLKNNSYEEDFVDNKPSTIVSFIEKEFIYD